MSSPVPHTREIRPVAASVLMLGACSMFAFNSIFVKLAAETGLHPFQIAFFRNFFALLIILPMVLVMSGPSILKPKRPGMLALRGGLNGVAMMTWFYAVPLMAVTDLTAIGFTGPIWATLLAAFFLGEKMRLRRWSAIGVGILGALIVVRPGFQEMNDAVYLVLLSSAMWGGTLIVIRRLTSVEEINTILVYQALAMAAIAFVPMLFVWKTPTLEGWAWMVGLGILAMGAHSMHTRAFSMQEVSALQPLDFARFPISAVGAYLLLNEVMSPWTALGALVVFAAGVYISHREAQVRRKEVAAAKALLASAEQDSAEADSAEADVTSAASAASILPIPSTPVTTAPSTPIFMANIQDAIQPWAPKRPRHERRANAYKGAYTGISAGAVWAPTPAHLYATAWGVHLSGTRPRQGVRRNKAKRLGSAK